MVEKCSPADGKSCDGLTGFAVPRDENGGLVWVPMVERGNFRPTVDMLGLWRPKRRGKFMFANFCPFCGVDIGGGFKAGCEDAPGKEGQ
jgi:hypothetical protein